MVLIVKLQPTLDQIWSLNQLDYNHMVDNTSVVQEEHTVVVAEGRIVVEEHIAVEARIVAVVAEERIAVVVEDIAVVEHRLVDQLFDDVETVLLLVFVPFVALVIAVHTFLAVLVSVGILAELVELV